MTPSSQSARASRSDGHYVKSLICDPKAKYFIRQGVLNDYSVGIINPEVRRVGDPAFRHLDPQGKAIGGYVTGRMDGSSKIGESPCRPRSQLREQLSLAKSALPMAAPSSPAPGPANRLRKARIS